ncbi:ABC transporter permease [Haloplasma contractile]|uniref:ABC-2 type transporter protein n=1 Tax=Haloplasma contractile SSD-17B TaxID=1033810 RepID=U2EES1_9MOLU|nr:ABC transporter permease [Haloplasma contractile]ERJ13196.1 ABC-2 type transporter protein [Haloplasma contractile SSD-17B]
MRVYISLFKMRLLRGLQYRVSALAGVSTQFFWGFMYVMIYAAFYTTNKGTQPIEFRELIQVIWLQQAFLAFVMYWFRDGEIINQIIKGDIAYELCRPVQLYKFWFSRLIAGRLSSALLRCIPILIVASLLPAPYNFRLPKDLLSFLLFLTTLILGLVLIVIISMLIYISMFYTLSPVGSLLMFGILGEFLGGMTLPVPLMPESLKTIVYILPFRYVGDLPFRIYAGHIGHLEAIISIGIQITWITVLYFLGNLWLNKSLKRIVVQGG